MRGLVAILAADITAGVLWITQQADNSSTDTTASIATLVVQMGLSAVFFWQWRDERTQRMKRDDQVIELAKSLGPLVSDATQAMKSFESTVSLTLNRLERLPFRTEVGDSSRLERLLSFLEERKNE